MKRISALLVAIICISQAKAQHTVSGIVTDKIDKTVLLTDVMIFIPEFDRVDFSKEGGTYILRNVGVGTVGLQFTKRGYKSIYKTISTFDSATVVNVEMEQVAGPLTEITDISDDTKFPEFSPFAVQLFSGRDLRRKGNNSMLTTLAYQPGIDIFSFGEIRKPVIRGLTFNHVAMYQSGVPLLHKQWDEFGNYEMIEEGVSQVEVVKGPASLIYGDNAMGGVLIYKDEKMPELGTINGDINLSFFTNTVGLNTDIGVKGSNRNGTFFSVRFGGKSHTSYIQGEGEKVVKNTEQRDYAYQSGFASGMAKGMFGISKKWGESKLSVSYLKSQHELVQSLSEKDIALIEEDKERDREITEPFVDLALMTVSSENIVVLKNSRLQFDLSYQMNNRDDLEKFSAENINVKYISNPSKKFGYIIGNQFQIQNIGVRNSDTDPNYQKSGNGSYLLLRYDVSKFNFLAGGRFDMKTVQNYYTDEKFDYKIPGGSIGIAYHPSEKVTLKLNESSGFSVPDQQNDKVRLYTIEVVPNKLTKLVSERNYESDFELLVEDKSVDLRFNAFYNLIDDYTALQHTSEFILFASSPYYRSYEYRQADATIYGGEFSLNIHPQKVKWIVLETGYSLERGKYNNSTGNMPFIPADKLTGNLRFQSESKNYLRHPFIEVGVRHYFLQDKIAIHILPNDGYAFSESATASYTLMDLNLGGSFLLGQQDFDFTVSVTNIFNIGYNSHMSRLKSLTPVPVREMGRCIALQFRIPFGLKSSTKS